MNSTTETIATGSVMVINKQEIKAKLINFTKISMIRLACDKSIDHRDYNFDRKYDFKKGELYTALVQNQYQMDETIEQIIDKLIRNEDYRLEAMVRNIHELYEQSNIPGQYNDALYDDVLYNLRNEMFGNFVDFVGFHEIYNLHSDYFDKFQDAFIDCFPMPPASGAYVRLI